MRGWDVASLGPFPSLGDLGSSWWDVAVASVTAMAGG